MWRIALRYRRCSRGIGFPWSSTWLRKRACDTRSEIRTPMSTPIWSASPIFWRDALVRLIDRAPQGGQHGLGGAPEPGSSIAPWRIYNVGNNKPQELLLVLDILEQELGRKAKKELLPMQPGDVPTTYADVDDLVRDVDFCPATPIEDGIRRFASWYRSYCEA